MYRLKITSQEKACFLYFLFLLDDQLDGLVNSVQNKTNVLENTLVKIKLKSSNDQLMFFFAVWQYSFNGGFFKLLL